MIELSAAGLSAALADRIAYEALHTHRRLALGSVLMASILRDLDGPLSCFFMCLVGTVTVSLMAVILVAPWIVITRLLGWWS